MKKFLLLLGLLATFSSYAMDDTVMQGPWCVLFNNFKPKMVRHANFHPRYQGYGCDNDSTHNLHLVALDSEYALPIYGRFGCNKKPPIIEQLLVAADNQQEYQAGNHQLVVLKVADLKSWNQASKYAGPPEEGKDNSAKIAQNPILYNASWRKVYTGDGNSNSNATSSGSSALGQSSPNNNRVEEITSSDWIKWAAVEGTVHEQITNWDASLYDRIALLKRATTQATLFCYMNQKLHADNLSWLHTRYQNEIRYLEGLGRTWIKKHSTDAHVARDTMLGSIAMGAYMGAGAGPGGAAFGAGLGATLTLMHKCKQLEDEDEYVYGSR